MTGEYGHCSTCGEVGRFDGDFDDDTCIRCGYGRETLSGIRFCRGDLSDIRAGLDRLRTIVLTGIGMVVVMLFITNFRIVAIEREQERLSERVEYIANTVYESGALIRQAVRGER